MSDVEVVAEAIHKARFDHKVWPCFDALCMDQSRRMAQAAIDALQLKEEKRNIRSICDMADTAGIDKRRWVSPWTAVTS